MKQYNFDNIHPASITEDKKIKYNMLLQLSKFYKKYIKYKNKYILLKK